MKIDYHNYKIRWSTLQDFLYIHKLQIVNIPYALDKYDPLENSDCIFRHVKADHLIKVAEQIHIMEAERCSLPAPEFHSKPIPKRRKAKAGEAIESEDPDTVDISVKVFGVIDISNRKLTRLWSRLKVNSESRDRKSPGRRIADFSSDCHRGRRAQRLSFIPCVR